MKIDWSFPRKILIALIVIGGMGWYPLLQSDSSGAVTGAIAGALIATVNVLAGYAAIEYSFGKPMATFFTYVLGGMGIRLVIVAMVLIVLIKVFHLHVIALVASMGVCTVVFLVLEILFIQKKIQFRQET